MRGCRVQLESAETVGRMIHYVWLMKIILIYCQNKSKVLKIKLKCVREPFCRPAVNEPPTSFETSMEEEATTRGRIAS